MWVYVCICTYGMMGVEEEGEGENKRETDTHLPLDGRRRQHCIYCWVGGLLTWLCGCGVCVCM